MKTILLAVALVAFVVMGNWWWLPQKWHACQKLYDNRPAQIFCLLGE